MFTQKNNSHLSFADLWLGAHKKDRFKNGHKKPKFTSQKLPNLLPSENTPEKQKNRLLSPLRYPQYYNGMHTSPYASFVESPNAHSQTFDIFIVSTHFVDFRQTNLLTSTLLSSIMKLTGKQGD